MNNDIKEILEEWKKFLSWCYENNDKTVEIHRDKLKLIMDYLTNLQKKYGKALELLADFNVPCEMVNCKISDEYCEENCSDDYKKCWDKYIELELKEDNK